ncbi:hypothetical protein [Desulfofundulus thermobenzoicus]|nr:hypothetical protein [Desulfofundulus thermobenzoicus]
MLGALIKVIPLFFTALSRAFFPLVASGLLIAYNGKIQRLASINRAAEEI